LFAFRNENAKMMELYQDMKHRGIQPDQEAYKTILRTYYLAHDTKTAAQFVEQLAREVNKSTLSVVQWYWRRLQQNLIQLKPPKPFVRNHPRFKRKAKDFSFIK